ncbi:hypothetical protein [Paraburkholderia sp. JPY419]|uniref:hypothetical protein n=1 Tax=Paraburkholderia sp. JPY419 TaxID=667660 RepID=UPI003D1FA09F
MRIFAHRVSKNATGAATGWERSSKPLVLVVCGWSLIEAPFELGVSVYSGALLVVAVPKLMLLLIGMAAITDLRCARQTFTFICAASVLATAPALPIEFGRCVPVALFSTIECIGKGMCATVLAFLSLCKR